MKIPSLTEIEFTAHRGLDPVSFVTASYLPRLGYRRAMILGHALVAGGCVLMAEFPSFHMA